MIWMTSCVVTITQGCPLVFNMEALYKWTHFGGNLKSLWKWSTRKIMEWLCREPRKIVIRLFNGTFSATENTNVWFIGGVVQGQSAQKKAFSSVTMTVVVLISVLHISAKGVEGSFTVRRHHDVHSFSVNSFSWQGPVTIWFTRFSYLFSV